VCFPDPGALDDLVTEVKTAKDGDTKVTGEEGRRGELTGEEAVETGDEDEEDNPEDTPVREPWLEPVIVRKLLTVDSLSFAPVIEAKEGDVHRQPGEETAGRRKSLKPVEDLISGVRNGQEGEEGE